MYSTLTRALIPLTSHQHLSTVTSHPWPLTSNPWPPTRALFPLTRDPWPVTSALSGTRPSRSTTEMRTTAASSTSAATAPPTSSTAPPYVNNNTQQTTTQRHTRLDFPPLVSSCLHLCRCTRQKTIFLVSRSLCQCYCHCHFTWRNTVFFLFRRCYSYQYCVFFPYVTII